MAKIRLAEQSEVKLLKDLRIRFLKMKVAICFHFIIGQKKYSAALQGESLAFISAHDRYITEKDIKPDTSIGNYKEVYANITNVVF